MDLLNPPRLDKQFVIKSFNRAAKNYDNAAILHEEVLNRLLQRLDYIRHQPATIIDIGCGTGKGVSGLQRTYPGARVYASDIAHQMSLQARRRYRLWSKKRLVTADMERLPFRSQSFDLIFSSLALHWSNSFSDTLAEFARIGKADGLLMFTSFGPGTLVELDASWRAFDRVPHIQQFVDMHDVGDALMAAGFNQPVVDAEVIRMQYDSFRALLDDLKNTGESNADTSRRRGLMTPSQLRRLEQSYREYGFEDGKYFASYEIVYGHAWMGQDRGGASPCG